MRGPSRSVYTGIFRFLLVTLLAFVLLAGTTFLIASAVAYVRGGNWNSTGYLIVGLSCGLIAWLFVAVFHLRHETAEIGFAQPEQFLAEAKVILHEMGYAVSSQQDKQLTFRPRLHAFVFGGAIQIVLDGHLARVTGPRVSLEMFRRYYRLQHHVQRVQKVLLDQRKVTDTRLKRVELRLRLEPEQFETVRKNVIAVLQEDGEVVCELNLLVHSVHGIREQVLEVQIREWLNHKEIPFDLHRDFVKFVEVVPSARESISV